VPASLTGKQRQFLRALAHPLKPTVQIGQAGLTAQVVSAIDIALRTHELIKVKVGGEGETPARDLIPEIEKATKSVVAQVIGHVLVVYRRRAKDPKIQLPRAKASARDEEE